ncbi:phosphonatase-like hydrolase [Rhodopirellula sp. JC740]|uniref:Phosphonatase-like hydrolase n=1 Tax=Rhodopirellula halodulae TaxID=2894198 RepID=A0ABS8NIZ2_9BACT|nr:phosphonatase-like hydrolase [Rhodopirellula sp. JC740]MCC9643527.1 phosphonatase-like hydrolase [Rhodopirellula sp. JC740]
MIELIVFDMAGTTVDENNVVYQTVRQAINQAGYSFTQEQVQTIGAGKEKCQAIRDVLASDGKEHRESEVQDIFSNFKGMLREAYQTLDVSEQPDATATFRELRTQGIKVVLNTGYDRSTAEKLIHKIGWVVGEDFDALVTASDVESGRPAPDMIFLAMALTGVEESSHVIKVGDSQIDIEEGQNAGCGMSLGITTGAQSESELMEANPTSVIHGLRELLHLVDPCHQTTA